MASGGKQIAIAPSSARRSDKHPVGLFVLASTELAERFSYYGMTALLALYMVKQVLLPEHAGQVLGLAPLRDMFEFRGPMSDQAFASLIYGWYGGLVYFTPILGGWLADRWLGTKRTVILGALLMSAGHLAMTFDHTFLVALLLLILGSGCLKGNISAQVGTLYPPDAESMRARGFTIFSTGINIGSVLGPLATGSAATLYGWHVGFGLAAVLMLIALAVYLFGSRHLPSSDARKADDTALPALTSQEKRRTWALVGLIALTVPANIAYPMIWNIGILWIDQRVDLSSPFGTVPASWFNSVDSFASIVAAAPLVALWAWQSKRKSEPSSLSKIAIGSAIIGVSALLMTLGCSLAGDARKVSVLWALAGYVGMGIGFMWYWPVTLALVSQAAPPKVNATLVSGTFLSLFFGSTIMGWVGSFYEQMDDGLFWALDGAIAFAGAMLIIVLARPLTRILEPQAR